MMQPNSSLYADTPDARTGFENSLFGGALRLSAKLSLSTSLNSTAMHTQILVETPFQDT